MWTKPLKMQRKMVLTWMIVVAFAVFAISAFVEAAPFHQDRQVYFDQLEDDPQAFNHLISTIRELRELENSKRGFGLDFGLGRGSSGTEAAKHMLGIAAANYAYGPGRRRRSEQV